MSKKLELTPENITPSSPHQTAQSGMVTPYPVKSSPGITKKVNNFNQQVQTVKSQHAGGSGQQYASVTPISKDRQAGFIGPPKQHPSPSFGNAQSPMAKVGAGLQHSKNATIGTQITGSRYLWYRSCCSQLSCCAA